MIDVFTTLAFFLGLTLNTTKNPNGTPTTIDLSPAVIDFVQAIKEWPQKQPTSDIKVRYLKRAELPLYVFANGQKPVRPKRKKREQVVEQNDQKKSKIEESEELTQSTIPMENSDPNTVKDTSPDISTTKEESAAPIKKTFDSPDMDELDIGSTTSQPAISKSTNPKKPVLNLLK